MPTRLCLHPNCPNPATHRGRCPQHTRIRKHQINRAGNHIYNTLKWKRTRERALSQHPLCPCGQIAEDVHHIVDLADGGNPWSLDGLQTLCHPCHSKITRHTQTSQ